MSTTQKPESLRLADKYEAHGFLGDHRFAQDHWCRQAAAELRSQNARIAELEAQLAAIGAGGVEPLRKQAAAPQAVQEAAVPVAGQSRFKGEKDWHWCSLEHVAMAAATPSELQVYEARYLYAHAAPAHPAGGVPAQAGAYTEARECEHCNHVGINDAANGIASCTACKWNGDNPKEDKCPDCEAEGTMTASCPKCHHEYRLIADATLAATQPAAQGMEKDAARYQWLRKSPNPACDIALAKHFGGGRGQDFDALIDAALAAQAKQGEQE